MTKNLNPRYTNKIYWKGGTIDSSTKTLSFSVGANDNDYKINYILATNTWTSAQTVTLNFLDSASATLSSTIISISGQAGWNTAGTTASEDLLASLPLPVDNAGNKQMVLPQNTQLQLENSAIQTGTTLTFLLEVGDYEAD